MFTSDKYQYCYLYGIAIAVILCAKAIPYKAFSLNARIHEKADANTVGQGTLRSRS